MRANYFEIASLLSEHGVVSRRTHPHLESAISWLVQTGKLAPVLPGIYAPVETASSLPTRLQALALGAPDAVVVGDVAAHLTWWPGLRVDAIECALPVRRPPRPGFVWVRRRVPADLVVEHNGIRVSAPALTAVDLSARRGGEPIDEALRARAVTLLQLHEALAASSGRTGNAERRRLLLESRDEPWSAAERRAHVLLREAGITGWVANHPVVVEGQLFYLDIAFRQLKLAIEIDGRLHEDDPDVFERDRERQNLLVLQGWQVLRFTWQMLEDHPDQVVDAIRTAMINCRR